MLIACLPAYMCEIFVLKIWIYSNSKINMKL